MVRATTGSHTPPPWGGILIGTLTFAIACLAIAAPATAVDYSGTVGFTGQTLYHGTPPLPIPRPSRDRRRCTGSTAGA